MGEASSPGRPASGVHNNDTVAIASSFTIFIAIAAAWIWLFFGFLQPWLAGNMPQ